MDCPKCGHKQNQNPEECTRCGVIFSKTIGREDKLESLRKLYREIPNKKIEQFARLKSSTLHPDAKYIIKQ